MDDITVSTKDWIVRSVWFVRGDEYQYIFEHKIDAERWARQLFPDDDRRYERIYYRDVYTYE